MFVVFKSTGQSTTALVQPLRDTANAVSVSQRSLPQIGTWGVVIFPYGDIRNGLWLGSYYPSMMDALTTTQASGAAATDPFIDYEAHFSGHWRLLDGLGNQTTYWPDGSWFSAASATATGSGRALPTVYRHMVTSGNAQQTLTFAASSRITSPPSGYTFDFLHKSGTQMFVDTSGNTEVSGNSKATFTALFGGGTLLIDTSGSVKASGSPNAASVFNAHFGNISGGSPSTLTLDASGGAELLLASGLTISASGTTVLTVTGNITVSGSSSSTFKILNAGTLVEIDNSGNVTVSGAANSSLTIDFGGAALTISSVGAISVKTGTGQQLSIASGAASASDHITLAELLTTIFNAHVHTGVQTGAGQTGTPLNLITASQIQSDAVLISA